MKHNLFLLLFTILVAATGCHKDRGVIENDMSEATVASETGIAAPLPADVISVTKPLVGGDLYKSPSFKSEKIASFDTSQVIQVLDTTDALFIKARLQKDTAGVTGFVSKTILPE